MKAQDELINQLQETTINEDELDFGDMVVKTYNPLTGLEQEGGRLIAIHVSGFNDGAPLFIGQIKEDAPYTLAVNSAKDKIAEKCREHALNQLVNDILGGMSR